MCLCVCVRPSYCFLYLCGRRAGASSSSRRRRRRRRHYRRRGRGCGRCSVCRKVSVVDDARFSWN